MGKSMNLKVVVHFVNFVKVNPQFLVILGLNCRKMLSKFIFFVTATAFALQIVLPSIQGHYSSHSDYVDLSYSFSADTIYFPGQLQFNLSKDYEYEGDNPEAEWYASYSFCMGEHGGTHLDAPIHFYQHGRTVEQIPLEVLVDVPGAVIDVEAKVSAFTRPGEYVLTVQDVQEHEERWGRIPERGLVLVHTGWGKYWGNKTEYLGIQTDGVTLSFPGVSEEAARWLYENRNPVGIGLDTSSLDPGRSGIYPAHRFMASKQVYFLENVANMKQIMERECDSLSFFVLPLKIVSGTGAPVNILARCNKETGSPSAAPAISYALTHFGLLSAIFLLIASMTM